MNRSEVQKRIKETEKALTEALANGHSEHLREYMRVMSTFHSYSFRNCMLIYMQCNHASRVAGLRRWNKFNRYVRKGEKGIAILVPCFFKREETDEDGELTEETVRYFKVGYVFDVSQTEGEDLPTLCRVSGDASSIVPALETVIRQAGIELVYDDTRGSLGTSYGGRIRIKPDLDSAERFHTLAHEYAHELLHKKATAVTLGGDYGQKLRTVKEMEADSVACIVSEYFGLDSLQTTAEYVQLWEGDKALLMDRLERIRETAHRIITEIEELGRMREAA